VSFLDELKKVMEVDAQGNYSGFKPLPSVDQTNPQTGIDRYLKALQRQTMRQAQPMNVGLLEMQRGGGMIPITPVQLESTEKKMQGLLDLMAMIKGPQG
jgi:hypothetical protein